jgi:hypothetical protein
VSSFDGIGKVKLGIAAGGSSSSPPCESERRHVKVGLGVGWSSCSPLLESKSSKSPPTAFPSRTPPGPDEISELATVALPLTGFISELNSKLGLSAPQGLGLRVGERERERDPKRLWAEVVDSLDFGRFGVIAGEKAAGFAAAISAESMIAVNSRLARKHVLCSFNGFDAWRTSFCRSTVELACDGASSFVSPS